MDSVKEVLESLRGHVRTRLSNPLYAAYIFTWVVLNFRVLLVLFSEGEWTEKIQYIDERMYPAWWHWAWFGFGYPLLVAIGIVLATPFIQRWISVFLREREKKTVAQLLKIAEETPLPPEEADRLRRRMINERQSRKAEESRLTTEIGELNAQIELLKKENDGLKIGRPPGFDITELTGDEPQESEGGGNALLLRESDFAGENRNQVMALVHTGLKTPEAEALYALRDGKDQDAFDLRQALGLPEEYLAQVLLDRLHGYRLVSPSNVKARHFAINSFGRQALSALIQRGFKSS